MTSKKSKGPAGGSTPIGPLKQTVHLARGLIKNLSCTAQAAKIDSARQRALVGLATQRRRGAMLQELADDLNVGQFDIARILDHYTCRSFRGDLMLRHTSAAERRANG